MRTAIDSSVLWSIFKGEGDAEAWVDLLIACRRESRLLVCDVVIAEIAPLFKDSAALESRLGSLGVEFDPILPGTAFLAGGLFNQHRRQGGRRDQLMPDFMIGAHAMIQADRLAARDRGYLRRYFPGLSVLALE